MSTLKLLGQADFRLSATAVPAVGQRGLWSVFQTDPSALAVAEAIIAILKAHSLTVSMPKREGRGGVWFRCEMSDYDAGISVMVSEGEGESVIVHAVACEIPKSGRRGPDVDVQWPEVSAVITAGVLAQFGEKPGFEWLGQALREPRHRGDAA